jgi:hypothetical protein
MIVPRLVMPKLAVPTPRGVWRLAKYSLLVMIAVYVARVHLGANAHTVLDGRVYRTAQLSGAKLSEYLRDHQIRTVINLRGYCPDFDWYRQEIEATAALGVAQEDITLSANRLPPPGELKRLLEVLDGCEYPIVLHCKQGADRTGLVSAMVLLLQTDASLARARRELLPHRGHFPVARTLVMDDFLDMYEAHLNAKAIAHSPEHFRNWLLNDYQPGVAVAAFAWSAPLPAAIPAQKPIAFTLRATNLSREPWRFTAGSTAGIHLKYSLYRTDGCEVFTDQAGLIDRMVEPGASIDLRLAFPALAAGEYRLRADLADYREAGVAVRARYFYQFGAPYVFETLIVK